MISKITGYFQRSKDDYRLMHRKKVGVVNVLDKDCNDNWARIVGWYVADVGGEKQTFFHLEDAMKAYDQYAVHIGGEKNPSHLNMPEYYLSIMKPLKYKTVKESTANSR